MLAHGGRRGNGSGEVEGRRLGIGGELFDKQSEARDEVVDCHNDYEAEETEEEGSSGR